MRRLIASGTWLATTAAATAMVWAATSVVAADVTDRPAAVLPQRQVVIALQTGSEADTAPAVTAAPTSTTTAPAPAQQPRNQSPQPPDTVPAPTFTPPSTLPPPDPTPSPTVPPPVTPPPTTQPSPNPTATYSTAGGTVTATCSGYFIRLVSATPTDGYAVEVLDRGPATVDVHFTGRGAEIQVRVVCFGGAPLRIPDQHKDASTTTTRRG